MEISTSLPLRWFSINVGIIVVPLVLLACPSFLKRLSSDNSSEKSACPPANTTVLEMTPRIVVIMAGDQEPTHIGVSSSVI
ncbi:hypothetical protein A4A49_04817 [Nicotiana attenuata]|uniref:Uncharacterized protein n=1 Tax=Nicotiana attenuata TaxID=49451 RepID=A0A314KYK6_NICAT|nr:hypothetical protein A4A49_04817 [Nicotiana attenuata]